jgi:geranylgeranyl pyrophosphate synthase
MNWAPASPEFAGRVAGRLHELAGALPEPLRSPITALAAQPGKGLRSTLLAACARFGGAPSKRLVRLAALVELLHLASLLHDDVIDRAHIRRGLPAAQVTVGPGLATLAGLACFALVGLEAASIGGGLDQLIGRTVAGLAYGELLDVERAFDTAFTLPDYLELVERKTGDLFRLCCELGAAEGRADPSTAQALAAFGTRFGVAFQILDDCLDLAADGRAKPAGTDHMLGLFGAPTLYALGADTSGRLAKLLLFPQFSPADMPAVRAQVTACGGLSAARRLARERLDYAIAALDGLAAGPRGDLVELAGTAWQELV